MNLANKVNNNLIEQIEYKIYGGNNKEIDLSLYDNIIVPIEYKIKNTSMVNLDQAFSFQDMGIDVFNLKDEFFNEIYYAYTDNNNSSSDIILSEPVDDIYQKCFFIWRWIRI